jgi:prepilin-type N-terminal cleavage/methylation domain-containing protein/prepilin-type processing-associated H-X9-DG protein
MKASYSDSCKTFGVMDTKARGALGFTLIELLVVIAIIAILAAIILPVLASAKVRAQQAQDMNNMKQVNTGIFTFAGDNNNVYPPAGWQNSTYQVSWDSIIYSYIGGGSGQTVDSMSTGFYANDAEDAQTMGVAPGLKVLACPFDTFPKVSWMSAAGNPQQLTFSVKDYEMVASGQGETTYPLLMQVNPATTTGLPPTTTPGFLNVGIYWEATDSGQPNWSALGYPETVVRHPSGTLLLVELASAQVSEGNIWPCCCCGPVDSGGWSGLYQINPNATKSAAAIESASSGDSEGNQLYPAQRYRFNYAFHDGHVELLQYQQTINPGGQGAVKNLDIPNGMWNINTAD